MQELKNLINLKKDKKTQMENHKAELEASLTTITKEIDELIAIIAPKAATASMANKQTEEMDAQIKEFEKVQIEMEQTINALQKTAKETEKQKKEAEKTLAQEAKANKKLQDTLAKLPI